jgi:hypothetical protein
MPERRTQRKTANNGMAICVNRNCKNYNVKVEVQRGNLTCPECGKAMQPIKGGSGNSKIGVYGGIAAAVLLIGGGAWLALSDGSEPKSQDVNVSLSATELTDTVGKTLPLQAVFAPQDSAKAVKWETADPKIAVYDENQGGVKLLKAGTTEVKAVINDSTSLVCSVTVIGKSGVATGGGSVSGKIFDNRAECVKTGDTYEITFVKPYEMELHDGTTQLFGIGDKIEGAIIRNGYLKQGEYVFKYGGRKFLSGLNNPI